MIFNYKALDKQGNDIADFIDASSESSARQKIRSQGLYLVYLKQQEIVKKKLDSENESFLKNFTGKISDFFNKRLSTRQIGLFSRQLGTLLGAGMPLPTAIADIIDQIDNKYFKNIIADIKDKIEEGSTFSNALERHRGVFSDMYISMVRVGENLGSLDEVIERLSEMEEKSNLLKGKIQSALWYPAFMLLFATSVVIFLLITVIPPIAQMFKDQNRALPLPTEIVLGISNILSSYWYIIFVIFGVGGYFLSKYLKTPEGTKKFDEIKLSIPVIKNFYKKVLVQRFTQNLGILMNNRVDIIKSFEIVEKIVGNVIIEEEISEATKKIKEGLSVSKAFSQSKFLPKLVLGMIAAGELSDNLDKMLLNIGKVYEGELDLTVASLTSLIEPIIIIIMGVSIGTIVMAVMLPIMQMNTLIQ